MSRAWASRAGYQADMFAGLSEENIERVKRQNKRKISVIIGNPPYNANQANENDNNKNREYKRIDELIKSSYIRLSTAQKTKVYDMYARFFRWASDRMHDDGVLAFVTNRSFIDSRTFDGFRKAAAQDFAEIYVMDLGGDVRANPKLSGTKNNVFGIQTGVAISFLVKRIKHKDCKIYYARRPEMDTADDKLAFLGSTKASAISYERVVPDKNGNWINLTENDWEDLIPVADKKTKAAKTKGQEKAIFRLFGPGVLSGRDDWVFDFDSGQLSQKINEFEVLYNDLVSKIVNENYFEVELKIKLSESIKSHIKANVRPPFEYKIDSHLYRPFTKLFGAYSYILMDRLTNLHGVNFVEDEQNAINVSGNGSSKPFSCIASRLIPSYDLIEKTQFLPRYRYTKSGERVDNITDWALKQFKDAYGKPPSPSASPTPLPDGASLNRAITKDAMFHYVYGVLHDPVYREKYAINLKREFPRIPFYPDFWAWAEWGERLMALHIGYEGVEPWELTRTDTPDLKARAAGIAPKAMLKADKDNGQIRLDSETVLSGIPRQAWDYRLGNRSGLEWILDQYKEKTPKDPTIREKFNTYRFADYKEKVVDLIMRVTRVSVETVAITESMKARKVKVEDGGA